MTYDELREAVDTLSSMHDFLNKRAPAMGRIVAQRLRELDRDDLVKMKRELRKFDITTRTWRVNEGR